MKLLSIILLTLVITIILNGTMQSYADPQLDALLKIATQARDNLRMSISQISNVPSEIIHTFKQGSDETDALFDSISKQDIASSRQHFLSAMKFYKQANDQLNSLSQTTTNEQLQAKIEIQNKITQIEQVGQRLKTIAITNHVNFDFSQFDSLIQTAKQDLDNGKIDDASKSIEKANNITIDAHHSISETANQRTLDRAKDFTTKQIERLDKLNSPIQNVTTPMSLSATITSNSTSENPKEVAEKMKKLASEGKINEALKIIKTYEKKQQQKSK